MVEYTAEHVLNRLHAMQGHALTVAERAQLFGFARDYAALLRERESANPAAWLADDGTGRVIDVKAKVSGSRAAATGSAVAAYSIPLFAHPERESAKVHDLVKTGDPDASSTICDRNGEVVLAYCRRCGKGEADLGEICESSKAAVTDEMVSIAIHGYDSASPSFHPSNKGMRAALKAVAPMLASARVPELENALRICVSANAMLSEIEDGKTLYEGSPTHSTRCLLAWSNLNTAIANAKQVLAAAPKPETEE